MVDVEKFVAGVHDYIARALLPLIQRIAALERRAPERGEKGEPGASGIDGLPGDKGPPGADGNAGASVLIGDVMAQLKPEFDQFLAALPVPKDGKDGAAGKAGASVTVDDLAPIMESALAKWALDFERRAHDILQRAIDRMTLPKDGKDGAAGNDGRDTLAMTGISVEIQEDGRTLEVTCESNGQRFVKTARISSMLYRGVYQAERAYERGDCVTFGGSVFVALEDTKSKPESDKTWQLAVKRGRDGRDGRDK